MSDLIRRVVIRGLVQGVGYRAWVEETADELKLAGWVRNCRDGSVEAVFAGEADIVEDMITRCRRGPQLARVDELTDEAASEDMLDLAPQDESFSVLPTI